MRACVVEEAAEFFRPRGTRIGGDLRHAIYVTLAWAALAMALAVAAAVPLARTVLAGRRAP